MNTSKLHVIAKALRDELARTKTVQLLQQATEALQRQVQQPQQSNHQQQLSNAISQLYQGLDGSPVNDYSPAWKDAMQELGVEDEFGQRLRNRISQVLERNQITPQTALEQLTEIHKAIDGTQTNLAHLVESMEYFGVGADELEPGECELGLIVPRSYVDDNLRQFGAELVALDKTLLVFSELVTGSRDPILIRAISSSDLSVFLNYAPNVAVCIAVAVERVVKLYKNLLEIKKLKQELADRDVPEENLEGIEKYAESVFKPALDKLAKELLGAYGEHLEKGRKKEIETELRHSLNKLANRVDRGFNIELRVPPPLPADNAENESEGVEANQATDRIRELAANISYLDHADGSLLSLPEGDTDQRGE